MANKKISQAASKASLEATDMIPLAAAGSTTAYHITGENLFGSLPAATDAAKGAVELDTQAETAAGTDSERAVTLPAWPTPSGRRTWRRGTVSLAWSPA